MANEFEIIKLIIEQWNNITRIQKETWDKIKQLFKEGDKSLAFIRRKALFAEYLELSQKTFLKKYSKYILPTEYVGYLLQAIKINELYEKGLQDDADKKREELSKTSPKASRLRNLYSCGVLSMVFSKIDTMITEGKNEDEIKGATSQMLEDLINDKSIIFVDVFDNLADLYNKIKKQIKTKGMCLVYGAGQSVNTITKIFPQIVNDPELTMVGIKHDQRLVGNVKYFSCAIYEQSIVLDNSGD